MQIYKNDLLDNIGFISTNEKTNPSKTFSSTFVSARIK